MKNTFLYSRSATLAAALAIASFASAGHADSVVTLNADGSVANVQAASSYAARNQSADTFSPEKFAAQENWNAAGNFQDVPDGEDEAEEEVPKTKKELALYPKGEFKVVNGKTSWVSPDGDVTVLDDSDKSTIADRNYRSSRYYPPVRHSRRVFYHSPYIPRYVFYRVSLGSMIGYWHRVPVADVIGWYPRYTRYGYPYYGYPGYGYPGYGYPGYGYYGSTTTFDGPGSITSTHRDTLSGGLGVSIGRNGVGINLRSGTTTTTRSTITADVAPGTRITTSTVTPYPYPYYGTTVPRVGAFGGTSLGGPPQGFGGTPGRLIPRTSGLGGMNNPYPSSAFGTPRLPSNITPAPSPVMIRPRVR